MIILWLLYSGWKTSGLRAQLYSGPHRPDDTTSPHALLRSLLNTRATNLVFFLLRGGQKVSRQLRDGQHREKNYVFQKHFNRYQSLSLSKERFLYPYLFYDVQGGIHTPLYNILDIPEHNFKMGVGEECTTTPPLGDLSQQGHFWISYSATFGFWPRF